MQRKTTGCGFWLACPCHEGDQHVRGDEILELDDARRGKPGCQLHTLWLRAASTASLLLSRKAEEPLFGGSLTPLSDVTTSFYPASITKLSRAASSAARVATRRSLISIRRAI